MLYVYRCGHTKSIDAGIYGTEFLGRDCDECEKTKKYLQRIKDEIPAGQASPL